MDSLIRTGKRLGRFAAALAALYAVHATALAGELVFETDAARYVISDSGGNRSLREKKSGRELFAGNETPFSAVRKGGKYHPVTSVQRSGDVLTAIFGQSGVSADFKTSQRHDSIVIELVQVRGAGVEEIRIAQLRVGGLANTGTLFSVSWDETFAVALLGLSDKVHARFEGDLFVASVYPEYGMKGEKAALVAVPKAKFMEAVRTIEKDFALPSPNIGGTWAKRSPDVRTSYLFTDLTEANADETIKYAKRAGFKYILIYSHIWSSSNGSYPINLLSFPRGEAGLKAVIDKCHAAGLKVGMHMMTSFVDKNDTLAHSRSQHLFSDAEQVLARDIGSADRDIPAQGNLAQFLKGTYGISKDVRIDDEIIHCETAGGLGSTVLMNCTRGASGTRSASHKAGAKLHHLTEYGGSYLADLRTPLREEIANRVAGMINRCGFDMIFYDGAEANCINGPCWYWTGQQELSITKKVRRGLLVQGSAISSWSWHITTRGYCDDFAAVAPKQYLDHHKIDHWWNFYSRSFLPVELGWWGFLSSAPDHPATTPDEAEFYAVRMLALDAPVSIETSFDALRSNGRTDEMLKLLGEYEQLRLSNVVPVTIREKLRSGEWHMMQKDGRPQFLPVRYVTTRPDENGEVLVKNEFAPQKLNFRLQAGHGLSKVGDQTNITLLPPGSPLVLNKPGPTGVSPGMLVGRILFTGVAGGQAGMPAFGRGSSMVQGGAPTNLTTHRALALKVNVEGTLPQGGEKGAVLNIQLESGGFYRDHFVTLDFTGERTIIIPEPNAEKMLPELRPSFTTYSVKSALLGFDYRNIVSVNFRWMRQSRTNPLQCTVTMVEALAETDAILRETEIAVGTSSVVIPLELKTGEYVEHWGDGRMRKYDRNGVQLSTTMISDALMLATGNNRVAVKSKGSNNSSVKLTIRLQGTALQF